jgi:hypothetical protein
LLKYSGNILEVLRLVRICPNFPVISFPVQYPGIDSETNRDANGRLFHIRPEEKYRFLIERLGFSLIKSLSTDDSLGREGTRWRIQVWQSL